MFHSSMTYAVVRELSMIKLSSNDIFPRTGQENKIAQQISDLAFHLIFFFFFFLTD